MSLSTGRHAYSYRLGPMYIIGDIRINEYIHPPSIHNRIKYE